MCESRHLDSESGSESRQLESESSWIWIHPFFIESESGSNCLESESGFESSWPYKAPVGSLASLCTSNFQDFIPHTFRAVANGFASLSSKTMTEDHQLEPWAWHVTCISGIPLQNNIYSKVIKMFVDSSHASWLIWRKQVMLWRVFVGMHQKYMEWPPYDIK